MFLSLHVQFHVIWSCKWSVTRTTFEWFFPNWADTLIFGTVLQPHNVRWHHVWAFYVIHVMSLETLENTHLLLILELWRKDSKAFFSKNKKKGSWTDEILFLSSSVPIGDWCRVTILSILPSSYLAWLNKTYTTITQFSFFLE